MSFIKTNHIAMRSSIQSKFNLMQLSWVLLSTSLVNLDRSWSFWGPIQNHLSHWIEIDSNCFKGDHKSRIIKILNHSHMLISFSFSCTLDLMKRWNRGSELYQTWMCETSLMWSQMKNIWEKLKGHNNQNVKQCWRNFEGKSPG